MERLLFTVGQVAMSEVRSDADYVDKLNFRYTTLILCVFAMVVSAKQYVGDPITCWCPAQFKDNYEDFTNKYCWVYNTYKVPLSRKHLPGGGEPKKYIGYYQWVPMFLLVQALLFYTPCLIWRTLNSKTGIDIDNVIKSARTLQTTQFTEMKEKTLGYITKNMDRYLKDTKKYKEQNCLSVCKHHLSRNFCMICGSRKFGNYLVALYMLTKVLYTLNSVGQLFILNTFLGTPYHLYGFHVIERLLAGEEYLSTDTFPRVTLCDFPIRTLNNIQWYTVQCVLPLNFFNEKMFILVWFWLVLVAMANILSLLTWFVRVLSPRSQFKYVKHHLRTIDRTDKLDWYKGNNKLKQRIRTFVRQYLRKDGVFILRLVELNSNILVVSELIAELFSHFQLSKVVSDDIPPEVNEEGHPSDSLPLNALPTI